MIYNCLKHWYQLQYSEMRVNAFKEYSVSNFKGYVYKDLLLTWKNAYDTLEQKSRISNYICSISIIFMKQ